MSLIEKDNLVRELQKIRDVMVRVDLHLVSKDQMNAALHMSDTIRPTPLGSAVTGTVIDIDELIRAVKG